MAAELQSRNEKVVSNIGLVYSCVKHFTGRGAEYDDLFQAGCLGLIKAADKFDESRGLCFSTYAVPVILGEIKRIFRDGGSVKIGRTVKEKSRKALALKEELTLKLGREPTVSELAESLGVDVCEASMLINASMPVQSLTFGEDGEIQADIPVNSHEPEISDSLALFQVLDSLEEKDRTMINLRYFLNLTQSETAKRLGMSQVQVSRREKAVLANIRKKLES